MKKHLKTFIAIFLLLVNLSCQKDFIEKQPLKIPLQNAAVSDISLKQLQDELKKEELGKIGERLTLVKSSNNIVLNNYSSNNEEVELSFDKIKKVVNSNYISYTLPISNKKNSEASFQNLTIELTENGNKAFLVTYIPSKEWRKKYIFNPQTHFEGKIKVENFDLNLSKTEKKVSVASNVGVQNENSIKVQTESCSFVTVVVSVDYNCTCEEHHSVGQACRCDEYGGDRPYTEYFPIDVLVCREQGGNGEGAATFTPTFNTTGGTSLTIPTQQPTTVQILPSEYEENLLNELLYADFSNIQQIELLNYLSKVRELFNSKEDFLSFSGVINSIITHGNVLQIDYNTLLYVAERAQQAIYYGSSSGWLASLYEQELAQIFAEIASKDPNRNALIDYYNSLDYDGLSPHEMGPVENDYDGKFIYFDTATEEFKTIDVGSSDYNSWAADYTSPALPSYFTPLTSEMIRSIGRSHGWDQGVPLITFNQKLGKAFQEAAIRSIFTVPGLPKQYEANSAYRSLKTNTSVTKVRPDYVGPVIDVRQGQISTYGNQAYFEVKAVSGTIYPSNSNYQIVGMIDALAANRVKNKKFNPGLFLITLQNTVISNGIKLYAARRGVELWQCKAYIDSTDGMIAFGAAYHLNNAFAIPLRFITRKVHLDPAQHTDLGPDFEIVE